MTTRFETTRAERIEARRMMTATMAHALDAEEIVSSMVTAMCMTDLVHRPAAEVQAMADWAMGELTRFVQDITDRLGHLADRRED